MTREIDPKLADSLAARMLSDALARASTERGLSMRKIGAMLGYKQAVVLSHMTTGRVPIPVERAEEIARLLQIDPAAFLSAILKQRHPSVDWELLARAGGAAVDEITQELTVSFGKPLRELNREQRSVMREVAADLSPRRRWLSIHELTAVEALRDVRPSINSEGLRANEISAIRSALRKTAHEGQDDA